MTAAFIILIILKSLFTLAGIFLPINTFLEIKQTYGTEMAAVSGGAISLMSVAMFAALWL